MFSYCKLPTLYLSAKHFTNWLTAVNVNAITNYRELKKRHHEKNGWLYTPVGNSMNSCIASLLPAWLPPLMTLNAGTGSTS